MFKEEFYPGDKIEVIVGRYRGKKGTILSSRMSRVGVVYEVNLVLDDYKGRNYNIKADGKQHSVITKMAGESLELISPPKSETYTGKRLLLI